MKNKEAKENFKSHGSFSVKDRKLKQVHNEGKANIAILYEIF